MSAKTNLGERTRPAPSNGTIAGVAARSPSGLQEPFPGHSAFEPGIDALEGWLSRGADETRTKRRYGVALALTLLAIVSAYTFDALGVEIGLLPIPILAIVVATFVSGFRAGLLAATITIIVIEVVVLEPAWRFDFDSEEVMGLLSFAGAAVIGGALSLALRESRQRALRLAEQRQRLLRAVLDNDRRLRHLADAVPVLIARATAEGHIDYFNRTLLDYVGKSAEDLEREGIASVIHPDDLEAARESFERRLKTGEPEVSEQRLRRRDGEYRWHLMFGNPVRDADGNITEWIGANVDIHDRKIAEEALQESEDRYRRLADSMEAMVCTSSREDGVFDFFNQRFYDYTGLTPETLGDRPMRSVIHPDDYDVALSRWNEGQRKGVPFSAEDRLRRHDGEYRWHFTRATPLPNTGAGGPRWVMTVVDIHDRKVAEEQLAASEQRYRALADSMEAIVCMSSRADGVIDFFNKQFFAYTGIDPAAMPDAPILQAVIHPDDFPRAVNAWMEARATNTSVQGEYRFRRRDGDYRWHIARGNAMPTAEGKPTAWVFAVVDIHDQKLAEHALRASETRYRTLIATAPVFVYNADPKGKVTFASQNFYDYTGMHPEGEDATAVIAKALHPDDVTPVRERWTEALRTGESFVMEARVRGSDGIYRWFLSRIAPEIDATTGDVVGWVGTSTNIDDRKRAEDGLRESREYYRALSDTVPALVYTNAQDGSFLFANRHYYEYTGLTAEQAARWADHGVLHPDDFERVHAGIEKLQRGEQVQVEVRLRRHDGPYRWHVASAMPLFDAQGTPDGWITVNLDIHERKIGEEREKVLSDARALLASSLDYQEVLDNLVRLLTARVAEWAAIHVRDDDGSIRRVALSYSDPAMQRYADSGNVIDPAGVAGVARVFRDGEPELILAPEEHHFTSIRAHARDAARSAGFQSSMMLPLQYQGKTAGVLAINSVESHRFTEDDVQFGLELARQAAVALEHARLYSTLHETAESLRAANAAKDEFLGLVSHELKTPITTILGNAEVLHRRGQLLDDEARAASLADIQHDAARLHQIIENLLILARLERGREIEMEPLLVPHMAERLIADHQLRYPHRAIISTIDGDILPVLASELYLEQVIRNLLSNAEKYSPRGEPIELRLANSNGAVDIDILDHGAGVPPEEREHIFNAFYRSKDTEHVAGVGIGLAVCKRLVEAMGGSVQYVPREDGGSCFRVTLEADAGEITET